VSVVEIAEAKIRETRLGVTLSAERVRDEDGTLNCTSTVWLTEYSVLRSKKCQNSSQNSEKGQKGDGGWGRNSGKLVDEKVSSAPDQNVTNISAQSNAGPTTHPGGPPGSILPTLPQRS
jgi:hypothetical protein